MINRGVASKVIHGLNASVQYTHFISLFKAAPLAPLAEIAGPQRARYKQGSVPRLTRALGHPLTNVQSCNHSLLDVSQIHQASSPYMNVCSPLRSKSKALTRSCVNVRKRVSREHRHATKRTEVKCGTSMEEYQSVGLTKPLSLPLPTLTEQQIIALHTAKTQDLRLERFPFGAQRFCEHCQRSCVNGRLLLREVRRLARCVAWTWSERGVHIERRSIVQPDLVVPRPAAKLHRRSRTV
jgi:hypothetical protein